MTHVVLPGVLRQDAGGASRLDIDLPPAATLADLLAELTARWPALARRIRDEQGALRRYVNVYVDGTDARTAGGLAAPLGPDTEVLVLPSIAGG